MNTCISRLLLCACMALSLSLFTGCGPKPVEPYQQKTGGAKLDGAHTFYDYASGAAATDYGAAAEPAFMAIEVAGHGGAIRRGEGGDVAVQRRLGNVREGTGEIGRRDVPPECCEHDAQPHRVEEEIRSSACHTVTVALCSQY